MQQSRQSPYPTLNHRDFTIDGDCGKRGAFFTSCRTDSVKKTRPLRRKCEILEIISRIVKVTDLPPVDHQDIEEFLLDYVFELWNDVSVLRIATLKKPHLSNSVIVEMGSPEDAWDAVRLHKNGVSARRLSRDWNRPLRLSLVTANALAASEARDIFKSPDVEEDFDFTASFQSPLQSPSLSRTDRRTVMSGRASDFSSRVPPVNQTTETPSPVEVFIKKDGEFMKIGSLDMGNLNFSGSTGNAALPRVLSTTKIQQTTATVTTSTHEPNLNDTMNSLSLRQGTPVPGFEDSPQQLYMWDQSPVADKSPLISKKMSRRFVYGRQQSFETNLCEDRPVNLRDQLNDSLNRADISFRSEELSLRQYRAEPDWLPSEPSSHSRQIDPEPLRCSRECQTSFSVTSKARQSSESVPKSLARLPIKPTRVFLKDLPTDLLPLSHRYTLKVIAVSGPDLIVLESPVVVDESNLHLQRRRKNIDSFCRQVKLPEPFEPKNNEVLLTDLENGAWGVGLYVGESHRTPKQDWARIVLLDSEDAGKCVTVGTSLCRPVPKDLMTDLSFIVARLNPNPKSSGEATSLMKQCPQVGKFVHVVARSHRGNCNEVDIVA